MPTKPLKKHFTNIPLLVLVLTNMLPIYGVVVMHIAILAGGFLSFSIGSPAGVLIVLIVLKTIIDVKLHLRQHRKPFLPTLQPV